MKTILNILMQSELESLSESRVLIRFKDNIEDVEVKTACINKSDLTESEQLVWDQLATIFQNRITNG
jgi:hypothetical protein